MINIREEIYSRLAETEGTEVCFEYPQSFTRLPVITYFERNRADSGIGGGELLTEIEIQIDIRNNGSTEDIFKEVNEKMSEMGLRRSFCQDLYDTDRELNHKIIRYKGVLNNIDGKIYTKI